jgi:CDP-diacylglycerol--glycerol-3-phosphate 3-phosphatidyltransferase
MRGLEESVTLKEWRRGTVGEQGGWTYHAKGLWVTLPTCTRSEGREMEGDVGPAISLVGSSNYTKRSYELDLETNALIVTKNEGLKKRLAEEERWLQDYAKPVSVDDFTKVERRVGMQVRIAMWIVDLVGGAL